MNETNWSTDVRRPNVTESDLKALEKAHRYEQKLTKKGYRWKRLSPRLSIFVECDKDGNPTEHGQRQIEKQKELHGIK